MAKKSLKVIDFQAGGISAVSLSMCPTQESVVLQEITKNMSEVCIQIFLLQHIVGHNVIKPDPTTSSPQECQRQAEVGAATSASLLLSNSGLDILERRLSEIRGDLSMVMRDSESWIDERAHYMTLLSEERKNNLELTNELATLRYEQSEILTASTCEVEARKRAEIRAEEGKQVTGITLSATSNNRACRQENPLLASFVPSETN